VVTEVLKPHVREVLTFEDAAEARLHNPKSGDGGWRPQIGRVSRQGVSGS
jgi:hypothetical protein